MSQEIKPNAIYTTEEARKILKISKSTIKRLLKNGMIRANKLGHQYRILGKEILRLVSPNIEKKAVESYKKIRTKVSNKVRDW